MHLSIIVLPCTLLVLKQIDSMVSTEDLETFETHHRANTCV